MPIDKEKRKVWNKSYREKHKEKIRAYKKQHNAEHKAYMKQYYAKNKEKEVLRQKKYRENNFHKTRILDWKRQGIIDGDFPLLNEVFEKETHCWICCEPYNGRKKRKCLDHDWSIKDDSNPRYICCHSCNVHVVG